MKTLKQIIEKTRTNVDLSFPKRLNIKSLREFAFYHLCFDTQNYALQFQDEAYRKSIEWFKTLTPFQQAEVLATYQIRYEMPLWRDDYE